MNFRFDTMYGFKVSRPEDVIRMNIDCGPDMLMGVPVVQSEHAVTVKVTYHVQRIGPPWKRRKRWVVRREEIRTPAGFRLADGTLILHPSVYRMLKQA